MNWNRLQLWLTHEGPYAVFWVTSAIAVVCLVDAAAGLIRWVWVFLAIAGILGSLHAVHRAMPHRRLNETLTPAIVGEIVAAMGAHVANRPARYGRESDLPYPRPIIEAALMKALRDTPEGADLETLKTFYMLLDHHMLSDADADALNRWDGFLTASAAGARLPDDEVALAGAVLDAGVEPAVKVMHELSKKVDQRQRTIEAIRGA